MKSINSIIIALSVLGLIACKEEIKPERGHLEEDPLGQLANVKALPGNGRFIVNGSIYKAGPAKTVTVTVAETGLNETVAIDRSTPIFSYEVNALPAGTYNVTLVVADSKGNKTEPVTCQAIVFDESCKGDFVAKEITEAVFNEDTYSMTIKFNDAEVSSLKISYTTSQDELVEKTIDGSTTEYTLADWLDESIVYVTSVAKPYPDAIDELELSPVGFQLPFAPDMVVNLPYDTFATVSLGSDAAFGQYGGGPDAMWKGSGNGFHSNGGVGIPCHTSFDLGLNCKPASAYTRYRGDFSGNTPRRFQIWGHPDLEPGKTIADYDVWENADNASFVEASEAAGWILLCDYTVPEEEILSSSNVELTCDTPVRFIRFRDVESYRDPYCNVYELSFKAWKKSIKYLK